MESVLTDIQVSTEWIPTWEKNDWKTAENKPVKNQTEFEELRRALEPMEVIWNHFPGHNGIEGNEAADRLAREGIDGGATPNPEPIEDTNNPSGSSRVIVDVPPLPIGSDESDVNMKALKKDLQKSFSHCEKSIEKKRMNISGINPDSLYWYHEGMGTEDLPVCTHVSEGEEDEQLLENLKALDPCGEFDDDAFPKRVQDFLKQYESKVSGSTDRPEESKETLIDCPKNTGGKSETDNKDAQSPVFHPKYSGVAGRATVRFKDLPEDTDSPIIGRPPPRRSLFPTSAPSVTPEARSTPFPTIEESEREDESPSRRGLEFKPRQLQRSETS